MAMGLALHITHHTLRTMGSETASVTGTGIKTVKKKKITNLIIFKDRGKLFKIAPLIKCSLFYCIWVKFGV